MISFRQGLTAVLLAAFASACTPGGGGSAENPATEKYEFPEKTVISDIEDEACYEGVLDKGIKYGRKFQDFALGAVADSVTLEKEKEYGEKFHEEIQKEFTFITDERLTKLKKIFKKVRPHVQRKELDYRIFLIESEEDPEMINAFTHVGGYIYFTTGLLEFAESEDELAFIMGHELGHNENRHVGEAIQKIELGQSIFGEGDGSEIFSGLMSILLASFNQPQELESDRAGMYLAYKGGYDPEKGLDFFRRLAQNETKSNLAKLFSTHPYSDVRDRCGMEYLNKARAK
jgi:predicted Zn-dependent protease